MFASTTASVVLSPRLELIQRATAHVESGEWDRAVDAIQGIETVVEGDIDTLESSLDDATPEHSSDTSRLQDLTGASDGEIEALYEYLAGEPVISEQFTITVSDARLSDVGGDNDIIMGGYPTRARSRSIRASVGGWVPSTRRR